MSLELPGVPAEVTPESEPFWAAGRRGELVVEQCDGCGLHIFPPRGVCRGCYGRDLHLRRVDRPGVVYSMTVNHNAWSLGAPEVYPLVLVEFPEYSGVRFVGSFTDGRGGGADETEPPAIGDLVGFTLVPAHGGQFQIAFAPWSTS
jgi:uncharacterized OB-fold protein